MADDNTTLTNGSLDALSQGQEDEPMGIKEALAERHQEFQGESNVTRLPASDNQVICEASDGWRLVLTEEQRFEADQAVWEYALAKERETEAKRQMEKAKARLLSLMGHLGAESVETPRAYVTVKEQPGRRTWDSKLLQELFRGDDEALKKYYRAGNPWMKISVKPRMK